MSATSKEGTAWAAEPGSKRGRKQAKQELKAARKKARKSRPEKARRTAERQIRFARFLALVLCAGGFLLIILGWAGAARRSCVDCQIPYLLSGGAAGLGLILLGVTIVVMAQLRTDSRRLAERIDAMIRIMGEWWGAESEPEPGSESEAESEPEPVAEATAAIGVEGPEGPQREQAPATAPTQGTYLINLGVREEPKGPGEQGP